jgi:hypothetical protein
MPTKLNRHIQVQDIGGRLEGLQERVASLLSIIFYDFGHDTGTTSDRGNRMDSLL